MSTRTIWANNLTQEHIKGLSEEDKRAELVDYGYDTDMLAPLSNEELDKLIDEDEYMWEIDAEDLEHKIIPKINAQSEDGEVVFFSETNPEESYTDYAETMIDPSMSSRTDSQFVIRLEDVDGKVVATFEDGSQYTLYLPDETGVTDAKDIPTYLKPLTTNLTESKETLTEASVKNPEGLEAELDEIKPLVDEYGFEYFTSMPLINFDNDITSVEYQYPNFFKIVKSFFKEMGIIEDMNDIDELEDNWAMFSQRDWDTCMEVCRRCLETGKTQQIERIYSQTDKEEEPVVEEPIVAEEALNEASESSFNKVLAASEDINNTINELVYFLEKNGNYIEIVDDIADELAEDDPDFEDNNPGGHDNEDYVWSMLDADSLLSAICNRMTDEEIDNFLGSLDESVHKLSLDEARESGHVNCWLEVWPKENVAEEDIKNEVISKLNINTNDCNISSEDTDDGKKITFEWSESVEANDDEDTGLYDFEGRVQEDDEAILRDISDIDFFDILYDYTSASDLEESKELTEGVASTKLDDIRSNELLDDTTILNELFEFLPLDRIEEIEADIAGDYEVEDIEELDTFDSSEILDAFVIKLDSDTLNDFAETLIKNFDLDELDETLIRKVRDKRTAIENQMNESLEDKLDTEAPEEEPKKEKSAKDMLQEDLDNLLKEKNDGIIKCYRKNAGIRAGQEIPVDEDLDDYASNKTCMTYNISKDTLKEVLFNKENA